MSDATQIPSKPKARLKFIDMARSFAILLMLEGHFTGAALDSAYRAQPNGDYEYPLFGLWHLLHGLTSPLFFTVTGLIFAYLLIGRDTRELKFWENIRVRKGLKRVLQLLFWGYLIQLNLWSIAKAFYYGTDVHWSWFQAFHVLQAIGIGLLLVIIVYRVYKWLNFGELHWYYLIAGLVIFTCYGLLKEYMKLDQDLVAQGIRSSNQYWPVNAPKFVQNMFYGEYSSFSALRMASYTLFGAMIGVIVRKTELHVKKWWYGTSFIVFGLLLTVLARTLLVGIDEILFDWGIVDQGTMWYGSTALSRFGQVIVLLGIIILIDKFFRIKDSLFLKIGQNTFPIYVVHVIILYGGLFGFGLNGNVFERDLHPWIAVAISASAIITFTIMVKYMEPLTKVYYKINIFHRAAGWLKRHLLRFWSRVFNIEPNS
ncbi:MAG: hypothetical protein Crog4KO_15350 [Crocinitomicaceae bacterium]